MFDNARQALTAALAENEFDPVAHFLMGELWFVDKEWLQARKEFRIAYSIQPVGLSAAGRMSIALANQFQKTADRGLRIEALQCAQVYLQRPRRDGADPFESEGMLSTLDSEVSTVQERLLSVSGKWVTGAGGEYILQEAGSSGVYYMSPNETVQYGSIKSTGPKTFEGLIASSGCVWELTLKESDDGMVLSGTVRVSQPPKRACRHLGMTKKGLNGALSPFGIERK
jgi:hypothetical protein